MAFQLSRQLLRGSSLSMARQRVSSFVRPMSTSSGSGDDVPPIFSGPQRAMLTDEVENDPWSAQQRVMVDRIFYSTPAATESEIRRDLQTAHRLMAKYGFDDLVWNHISARCMNEQTEDCCDLPTDSYLITPGGKHFSEVRAEDLVFDTIEESGNVIHSGIYAAREDVRCIIHAHTPAIMAVACLQDGFKFLTQDSAPFYGRLGYHDWEGLSPTTVKEEERIARNLGENGIALIMRNHGATVVGKSIQEAWVRMYYLNRCCQVQIDAMSTGAQLHECPPEMLRHAAEQLERYFPHGKFEWRALSRLVN